MECWSIWVGWSEQGLVVLYVLYRLQTEAIGKHAQCTAQKNKQAGEQTDEQKAYIVAL